MIKRYKSLAEKRKVRTRKKFLSKTDRPRLSVFRSNRYIYAQIIDDKLGKTLVAASEKEITDAKGENPTEKAKLIGQILAKKALEKKIKSLVFDRGAYKYHGRVKALAEGARDAGLKF